MGFQDDESLTLYLEDFEDNPVLRELFKLLSNSFLGKFSQRDHYPASAYITSTQDIRDILNMGNSIVRIQELTEMVALADIELVDQEMFLTKQSKSRHRLNRRGNVIIGAFITCYARIDMHKSILAVQKSNCKMLYTDTDGLVFLKPKDVPLPLEMGLSYGQFKHELGEGTRITSFYALGKKNYLITYKDKDNAESSQIKVSGLQQNSTIVKEFLTVDVFLKLFHDFQNGKPVSVDVPQARRIGSRKKRIMTHQLCNFHYSNDVKVERIIDKADPHCQTYPYGYYKSKRLQAL